MTLTQIDKCPVNKVMQRRGRAKVLPFIVCLLVVIMSIILVTTYVFHRGRAHQAYTKSNSVTDPSENKNENNSVSPSGSGNADVYNENNENDIGGYKEDDDDNDDNAHSSAGHTQGQAYNGADTANIFSYSPNPNAPSFPQSSIASHQPSYTPLANHDVHVLLTNNPTITPSSQPTTQPSALPTKTKTYPPSSQPSPGPLAVTYVPGLLETLQNKLLLSKGLSSRILAQAGELVRYDTGYESSIPCHVMPDFGATFVDTRSSNRGGYIYVSNSETRDTYDGGVGAFTFDSKGQLIDYRMLLQDTRANCGGGRTPWGAWISCEEFAQGQIYQVDPTGEHEPVVITLGMEGGMYESFSYDIRSLSEPHFFVTEDHERGPLRRFTPYFPDWLDPWNMLLGSGETLYLMLTPDSSNDSGTFDWTDVKSEAQRNANLYYPNSEGIDILDKELYFVSKIYKTLFVLDLDTQLYKNYSTSKGLFDGQPDELVRILGDTSHLLYFTEDGGRDAGIHARDNKGQFFTILESPYYQEETTGLSFSPDGTKM
jgi:uncharacterized protein